MGGSPLFNLPIQKWRGGSERHSFYLNWELNQWSLVQRPVDPLSSEASLQQVTVLYANVSMHKGKVLFPKGLKEGAPINTPWIKGLCFISAPAHTKSKKYFYLSYTNFQVEVLQNYFLDKGLPRCSHVVWCHWGTLGHALPCWLRPDRQNAITHGNSHHGRKFIRATDRTDSDTFILPLS